MRRLFLDTGVVFSILDARDTHTLKCRAIYFDPRLTFITHELVLVESFSLITKRIGKEAAVTAITALRHSARVEVIPVDARLLQAAWQRCLRFRDKEWDWIDSISFQLMEERGLQEAFALDHHFRQAGFTTLPE